jgi:hypothetical protein
MCRLLSARSGEPDIEEALEAPGNTAAKDEGSSIPSTTFNLTNTIIGAGEPMVDDGMQSYFDSGLICHGFADPPLLNKCAPFAGIMALPQAVATLGIVLGSLLIVLVYILSYVTIDILARWVHFP